MTSDPERAAIDHVAQRLSRQFTNLDTTLVARVVWDTYRHFDTHPTRDVVPILVQDAARDRLRVMPAATRTHLTRRRDAAADPGKRSLRAAQGGSANPMVISVINWRMAARKAMISARSGSPGCTTAGSWNANSSSSPSNPARRSLVARRQPAAMCT